MIYSNENLRLFLNRRTNIVSSSNFNKETMLFSWENLYVIVSNYIEDLDEKNTLGFVVFFG